jgi:hypothetical protein
MQKSLQAMPMRVCDYKEVVADVFMQLAKMKEIITNNEVTPIEETQKIDFKFKKQGMTKLLLFDLDETLIHVKRDSEDHDSEQDSFEPEVELPVFDPETGFYGKRLFSIRPFARKCLAFAL